MGDGSDVGRMEAISWSWGRVNRTEVFLVMGKLVRWGFGGSLDGVGLCVEVSIDVSRE